MNITSTARQCIDTTKAPTAIHPAPTGKLHEPRNFHDKAYMSTRTDAQLLEVIHSGKGAMPKWGGLLSEAEISAVLAHVRSLGTKP